MSSEISSNYRRVVHGPPPHLPKKRKNQSLWKRLILGVQIKKLQKQESHQSLSTRSTITTSPAIWTHPNPTHTYAFASLSPAQLLSRITQNIHTISKDFSASKEFKAAWALLLNTFYASISTPGLTTSGRHQHSKTCEQALTQAQFSLLEQLICPGTLTGSHCVLKFVEYDDWQEGGDSMATWEQRHLASYDWRSMGEEGAFGISIIIHEMDPRLAGFFEKEENGEYWKNRQTLNELFREVVKAFLMLYLRLPWSKEEWEEWYGDSEWVVEIFKVAKRGLGSILGWELYGGSAGPWREWFLGCGGHEREVSLGEGEVEGYEEGD